MMAGTWTLRAVGGSAGMVADVAEVRRALELFVDPELGCELMALRSGIHRTLAGNDLDGLCTAAAELPGGSGIYFRINPVAVGRTSPANNGDIVKRRWVYIDVDPAKPEAEKDSSATDGEKARTYDLCHRVRRHLMGRQWPEPVIVDSGNGHALFFRCDLPNDQTVAGHLRQLLKELARTFSGPDGVIDKAVHNANRLVKLPGTWARKGVHTEDRPHRVARLVNVPASLGIVDLAALERATGVADQKTPSAPKPSVNGTHRNGTARENYLQTAIDEECERVVSAGMDGRNNMLNRAAFSLGQLVAGGELARDEVETRLYEAACRSGLDTDSNCGERGIWATIRSGLESGLKEPRRVPEAPVDPQVKWSKPWSVPVDPAKPADAPTIYTVPELLGLDLPAPRWAIPGLLSEGLTIMAGKPKLGKSWMALNLALTIAAGGKALNAIQVEAGDVLYLALEDRLRRIRDRAAKVLGGLKVKPPALMSVAVEWKRQDKGGVHDLAAWLEAAKNPRLVVIDVWAKFRSPAKSKGSAYEQDYDQLTEVKSMADHYGASVLALHHTRKSAAEDVFDEISGTLGIAGAADGSLVLARARGKNEGTLAMTGRDIEEQTLAVEFNPATFTWTSHGNAEERIMGALQQKVFDYLKNVGRSVFVSDIATALNEPADKIRPTLHRLEEKKQVRKVGAGWAYPGIEDT